MQNVSHKKRWGADTNRADVEPPAILLIKEMYTGKSDGNYGKLKLRRDYTSSTSNLDEFRMSLCGNVKPEELKMNLAATGTLETDAKVQVYSTHG